MKFDFNSFVTIAVIGPQGSGRTSTVIKWTHGGVAVHERLEATPTNEIIETFVNTNYGRIKLKVIETVGQEFVATEYRPSVDHFAADAFVLMFDLLSTGTLRELGMAVINMEDSLSDRGVQILTTLDDANDPGAHKNKVPVVVLGNKCDKPVAQQKCKPHRIKIPMKLQVPYWSFSTFDEVAFKGGCFVGKD